ncbi:Zn(2)-C6 fungal-type domain-containing protein [Mycena sanguinolenta]|uniref:Zn(2)-C6 fungal-type domain-containing protein n=1 Tax=Mycena sanguinolenta TaxID=230812 RepID=A0A8H6YWA8_9AGAR|nr:Zn(2)-C6 fungal-type domain-containing protein [Mycena sanguinolenta]
MYAPPYALPFSEYDDPDDDEPDTPGGASAGAKGNSKAVRRRSSKACDQCRKSKCKCERPAPGEPCRSCVVLQTECTSLGPSRKRGPPKGYIDAIEARLHQTEALVGIMLAAARSTNKYTIREEGEDEGADDVAKENESDERARELLADLSEDPLARAIPCAHRPERVRACGALSAPFVRAPTIFQGAEPGRTGECEREREPRGGGRGAGGNSRLWALTYRAGRVATPRMNGWTASQHTFFAARANDELNLSKIKLKLKIKGKFAAAAKAPSLTNHSPSAQTHPIPSRTPSPIRISMIQVQARAQRPAIVTALNGRDDPRSSPASTSAFGQRGYPPPSSFDSEAGTDGRRVRRRVDEGPSYGYGRGGRDLGYRDASADYGRGREGGRGRSYSPDGSGSEAELDVDVPHSPPPRFAATSYLRSPRDWDPNRDHRDRERGWDHDRGTDSGRDRGLGRGAGDRDRVGGAEGLAGAVGQLSLNEDKQVRYHGKISGLHLLARRSEVVDEEGRRGRSQARRAPSAARSVVRADGDVEVKEEEEGDGEEVGKNVRGIWRFPKARVWPVAPAVTADDDYVGVGEVDPDGLPPRAIQEALLARYFTYVHPSFPVVHKRAVQDAWARGEGPPPLLLLAMFALAARHAPQPPSSPSSRSPSASPAPSQYMWPAGDAFLFRAKALLDSSYASSRASTCQALLLMGFREIGIGAMAQAWIYIGMAVRMAQDLGMQRDADGWVRAGVRVGGQYTSGGADKDKDKDRGESAAKGRGEGDRGQERWAEGDHDSEEEKRRKDGKLFGAWDIAERRRIWYACVIMDKYVSTYIGRPLAIFERDFDTSLPSESDAEELEGWAPPSDSPATAAPRPGHVISCFNASARLAGILSQIVQSIYALRPASSRHAELVVLDGLLEKWHLALPTHLQHDPARTIRSGVEVPLQQVLTLHMQYWCAVLLLHRPFIRQNVVGHKHSPAPEDGDVRKNTEKSYELCAGAANHITTIATLYSETYTLKHCAVFLCYYIFTASIMHVTSLSAHPTDPQARMGLTKCMDMLKEMEMIWPAAGRALELLRGAQATLADAEDVGSLNSAGGAFPSRPRKRPATQSLNDSFAPPPGSSGSNDFLPLRPYAPVYTTNGHYEAEARSAPTAYYPSASSPYDRWPTEAGGGLAFQGALSTAVMGPAYSTGLVEERHRAPPPPHEGEPRFGQPLQQPQQYWNEYAAFPPLGYGELHDPSLAVHEPQQIYPLHDFGMYPQNQ